MQRRMSRVQQEREGRYTITGPNVAVRSVTLDSAISRAITAATPLARGGQEATIYVRDLGEEVVAMVETFTNKSMTIRKVKT